MMTDPIADMIARIRNAGLAHLDRTEMPLSKVKRGIAAILKDEGYIEDYSVNPEHPPTLTIVLKYTDQRKPAIKGMKRKSRPGKRVYSGFRDFGEVLKGMGVAIVSTAKGRLMTDKEARELKVGGEILAEVW